MQAKERAMSLFLRAFASSSRQPCMQWLVRWPAPIVEGRKLAAGRSTLQPSHTLSLTVASCWCKHEAEHMDLAA